MSTQLLIYRSAVPVTGARHFDCSIEARQDYAFSSEVNSVPLMAVEFPLAASEYPIVFVASENEVLPAVILGLRDKQNLYLTETGSWDARYVPAFVRRYPFVFSKDEDRFLLCIDERFEGFNREGRGERLFDQEGKPTQYVENVLKFLQDYQAHFHRTQAFCAKLKELELLEPMQAQVSLGAGNQFSLSGFMAVDRAKLKALSGETLQALAQTDELELLYLHLNSMRIFDRLKDRLGRQQMKDTASATPDDEAEGRSAASPKRGRASEAAKEPADAPA
ncbi:SapC family protein [Bosea sp. F3-2]|nr:SapC family protein [Bosea sp. F3-2]